MGTYEHNRKKIARVHEGDAVIFTGEGSGWAVGVVGYRFENADFAQQIWQETKGAAPTTYLSDPSLRFSQPDISYAAINEPLGLKPNNHFQAMAVYDKDGKGDAVVDALYLNVGATTNSWTPQLANAASRSP